MKYCVTSKKTSYFNSNDSSRRAKITHMGNYIALSLNVETNWALSEKFLCCFIGYLQFHSRLLQWIAGIKKYVHYLHSLSFMLFKSRIHCLVLFTKLKDFFVINDVALLIFNGTTIKVDFTVPWAMNLRTSCFLHQVNYLHTIKYANPIRFKWGMLKLSTTIKTFHNVILNLKLYYIKSFRIKGEQYH